MADERELGRWRLEDTDISMAYLAIGARCVARPFGENDIQRLDSDDIESRSQLRFPKCSGGIARPVDCNIF
jgi:hypothetical protein